MSELLLSDELKGLLAGICDELLTCIFNNRKDKGSKRQFQDCLAGFRYKQFRELLGKTETATAEKSHTAHRILFIIEPGKPVTEVIPYSVFESGNGHDGTKRVPVTDWIENQRTANPKWITASELLRIALGYAPAAPPITPSKSEPADPIDNTATAAPAAAPPFDQSADGKPNNAQPNNDFVSQLFTIRTDWQKSNVPDGQDLSLDIKFGTVTEQFLLGNERVDIEIAIHRLYIDLNLDGGLARIDPERLANGWFEYEQDGPNHLKIVPFKTWRGDAPQFELNREERSTPLAGHFRYFPLCNIHPLPGDNPRIVAHFRLQGIRPEFPPTVIDQLEGSDRAKTEENLLTRWLSDKMLEKEKILQGNYRGSDRAIGEGTEHGDGDDD
ncbi:hypothetical protein [Novosphingobium aquae]|uniref:Uncharacterized protein n=1 Tax=Novosphingobium aquae TaxID=3133435 RepID=A0ABU8S874_9SPHN